MTGTANTSRNVIFNADCIQAMRSFDRGSVDFILTDPPYIVNYRGRDGRKVANDDNARCPEGHLKLPHLWSGQTPPPAAGRRRFISMLLGEQEPRRLP
ncbi:hypothetical protein ACTDI4_13580 [Mesorhizobium sp. PUT5]|uniref:hypothetical protein n=1 Tax=Mesorhizobium sp. PUT5 TaxID=3454629 RepID=UPI003FA45313